MKEQQINIRYRQKEYNLYKYLLIYLIIFELIRNIVNIANIAKYYSLF
jgi:hypothetical protein